MNSLVRDIGYALRQMRRAPGFAVTAVLTLALGIGASSAIFCLIGLALGVVLAAGAARLEASLVFGVSPLNALSIAGALGILAFAIAAASWLPTRRAASIDPMQALRTE